MVTRRQLRGWMCAIKVIPANNIIRKSDCSHRNKCMNVSSFISIFVVVAPFCLCFGPHAYFTLAEDLLARGITDSQVIWNSLAPRLIIHSLLSCKKDGKVQMASWVGEHMDFKKKWSFLLSSSSGKTLWCCGTVIIMMMVILMTSYFDALWFVKCFSFTLLLTLGIKSCIWLDSFDS